MDRKRGAPDGPGEAGADEQPGEHRDEPGERPVTEHFGPLELTRLHKDDGRALLHFTREPRVP